MDFCDSVVALGVGSVGPVVELAAKALSDAADNRPVRARAANLEFFMRVSPYD
jgi:hypothetical protein